MNLLPNSCQRSVTKSRQRIIPNWRHVLSCGLMVALKKYLTEVDDPPSACTYVRIQLSPCVPQQDALNAAASRWSRMSLMHNASAVHPKVLLMNRKTPPSCKRRITLTRPTKTMIRSHVLPMLRILTRDQRPIVWWSISVLWPEYRQQHAKTNHYIDMFARTESSAYNPKCHAALQIQHNAPLPWPELPKHINRSNQGDLLKIRWPPCILLRCEHLVQAPWISKSCEWLIPKTLLSCMAWLSTCWQEGYTGLSKLNGARFICKAS